VKKVEPRAVRIEITGCADGPTWTEIATERTTVADTLNRDPPDAAAEAPNARARRAAMVAMVAMVAAERDITS